MSGRSNYDQEHAIAIAEIALKPETVLSSHHDLQIGGINTHIYGLSGACHLVHNLQQSKPWVILHLIHPRTRDYTYTEKLAHLVLEQYYKGAPDLPMIAVTFDLRNHGARKVSDLANLDWQGSNPTHAQDMMSGIQGSAQDVELVMEYLPTYLPALIGKCGLNDILVRQWGPERYIDVVSGVSQGGHVAWQVAVKGRAKAVIPIIGTPYLTYLLIHRRLAQSTNNNLSSEDAEVVLNKLKTPLYKLTPDEVLEKVFKDDDGSHVFYPNALHEIVAEMDRKVFEEIPNELHVLIINAAQDPLVPSKFSNSWLSSRPVSSNSVFFQQPDVGHVCTQPMVDRLSQYLKDLVGTL